MSMLNLSGNVIVQADNAKGLLLVNAPAESFVPDSPMPSLSRFHGSDIGFYSASIKANIAARIAAF
jgi:hypothetical protein